LLTEARELQISGNCMTQQEARVKILNLAIDQRKSRGLDVTEFTISETTMKRCLKNLKEVKRPQIRSERRAQAENELWNAVSLAATVGAAFGDDPPSASNVWNYDASSLRLSNTATQSESVFIAPGEKVEGVKRTAKKKSFTWQTLKFHCLTNANGLLGPPIFTLRGVFRQKLAKKYTQRLIAQGRKE
jgi:hypothetical protein